MHIQLNGKRIEVKNFNLSAVLQELNYGDAIIATAINGEFVPVSDRPQVELNEGDMLEVLAPMQGG